MTKFTFQKEEFNITENNIDDFVFSEDNITNIIKSYLKFIYEKSTVPKLPSNINIVYIDDSSILQKVRNAFKSKKYKKPAKYAYPASIDPDNSTLYISKDFNKSNNTISKIENGIETNDIVLFRNYFNQDNKKVIEYVFGHELGHFFILSKNHKKPKLEESNIIMRIASNIEEGFAEAFSIQLMYLKESNFNINPIKNGRFNDFKKRIKLIESDNYTKEDWIKTFKEKGFEYVLNKYDFKELFDNLPIRNKKNEIEKDINVIYDKCLEISMNNNKQAILSIMKNPYFNKFGLSENFENLMKDSLEEKDRKNIITMIDGIHTIIKGKSFNKDIILMLREKHLNNYSNTIKPTNKI